MTDVAPVLLPPGKYPDGKAGRVRGWDGHSWTSDVVSDPAVVEASPRARFGIAVLKRGWFWICVLGFAAGVVAGYLATQLQQNWLAVAASIGVVSFMIGMIMFTWQTLYLADVISVWSLLFWGVLAGAVGYFVAYWAEGLISSNLLENASTGPIEEGSKLLIPVILYFAAGSRFRDPRVGFAIVLVSACVFGIAEGVMALQPITDISITTDETVQGRITGTHTSVSLDYQQVLATALVRPFDELVHPVLTGFIGAVAWFFAWHRHRFFTGAAIGAFVLAAVLHSGVDVSSAVASTGVNILVGLAVLVCGYYLLYRPNVRQLVPPSAIATNEPWWRPHLDKSRALKGQQSP